MIYNLPLFYVSTNHRKWEKRFPNNNLRKNKCNLWSKDHASDSMIYNFFGRRLFVRIRRWEWVVLWFGKVGMWETIVWQICWWSKNYSVFAPCTATQMPCTQMNCWGVPLMPSSPPFIPLCSKYSHSFSSDNVISLSNKKSWGGFLQR